MKACSAFGISKLGKTSFRGVIWVVIYSIGYFKLDLQWIILVLGAWYCFELFWRSKKQHEMEIPVKTREILSKDLPSWVVSKL